MSEQPWHFKSTYYLRSCKLIRQGVHQLFQFVCAVTTILGDAFLIVGNLESFLATVTRNSWAHSCSLNKCVFQHIIWSKSEQTLQIIEWWCVCLFVCGEHSFLQRLTFFVSCENFISESNLLQANLKICMCNGWTKLRIQIRPKNIGISVTEKYNF